MKLDNHFDGSEVALPKEDLNKGEDNDEDNIEEDRNLIFAPIPANTVFPDFIWGQVEMLPVVDHGKFARFLYVIPFQSHLMLAVFVILMNRM